MQAARADKPARPRAAFWLVLLFAALVAAAGLISSSAFLGFAVAWACAVVAFTSPRVCACICRHGIVIFPPSDVYAPAPDSRDAPSVFFT